MSKKANGWRGTHSLGASFVNGWRKATPRLPFGGIKARVAGRELSVHGIHEFVNIKTMWIQITPAPLKEAGRTRLCDVIGNAKLFLAKQVSESYAEYIGHTWGRHSADHSVISRRGLTS
jgi:hypothetical protein